MKQGNIVLVPFPFSDLTSIKTRPALVISNKNLRGDDVILCGITSQNKGNHTIVITNNDLKEGELPLISYVKAKKIVSLHKNIIKKIVAEICPEKMELIIKNIYKCIKPC